MSKASNKAILQNICSWGSPGKFDLFFMILSPPGKSYVFWQNFEKALQKIMMCSSTFHLSWKIYKYSCTLFGSHGKFDMFL